MTAGLSLLVWIADERVKITCSPHKNSPGVRQYRDVIRLAPKPKPISGSQTLPLLYRMAGATKYYGFGDLGQVAYELPRKGMRMRHRTLGDRFSRRFHSSESRRNHNFSMRSDFQFKRSHARIEASRVETARKSHAPHTKIHRV